ncbi:MAG: Peptidase serralysin terminal, partial [Pseudomonadota bacterium]
AGSGVHTVIFGSAPATAMTINGLGSGAQISLLTSQTTITTVNLVNADTRTDEILLVDLGGSADFGNNTLGLIAPHLSELQISSRDNAHTMYISEVGDASDFATLSLFGGKHLTLIASNGSTSFIDKIVSTNTAGIDMLGMLEGTKALASSGVGILGGSGSDVLVGGTGADTIIGGAGDDTIYGSLGVDAVDLSGGGVDMLIFRSQAESAYNSGDNIVGFSIFSGIDISDLVSSVSFGGNVANNSEGLSKLSTNHSVGFFNTTNHMLYVDIDHDGSLTSVDDMAFQLNGLNSFNGSSLIG